MLLLKIARNYTMSDNPTKVYTILKVHNINTYLFKARNSDKYHDHCKVTSLDYLTSAIHIPRKSLESCKLPGNNAAIYLQLHYKCSYY